MRVRLLVKSGASLGDPVEIGISAFALWPPIPFAFEFAAGDLPLLFEQGKGSELSVCVSTDRRSVHVVRVRSVRMQGTLVQCTKTIAVRGVECSRVTLPEIAKSAFDQLMDPL